MNIKQLLLGSWPDPGALARKRRLLVSQLALVTLLVSVLYVAYNWYVHKYGYVWVYCGLFAIAYAVILLNRRGHSTFAAVTLGVVVNFIVFIFTAADLNDPSGQVFYPVIAVGGIAVFAHRPWIGYGFVALPLTLLIIVNFTDWSILPHRPIAEQEAIASFYVNILAAFVALVLIAIFFTRNHTRVESELTESRHRYELAIKGSRAGIWEWDIRTNVVNNSPVWKAMLGYDEHELNDMTVEKFLSMVHPDDRHLAQQAVMAHIERQEPYLIEFRMIRKDGSIIWLLDSGQAVWNDEGKPVEMVGSILDISERKEAEQKIVEQNKLLVKANAELDRFVYSASHDLRSPLSSLLGLINLGEKTNDPQQWQEYLRLMRGRIMVMDEFIREIIQYSQNARSEIKREPVDLGELTHDVIEGLKYSDEGQRMAFRLKFPDGIKINTDKSRLRVVLNNLIGNSIKYSDRSKSTPEVSLEAEVLPHGWSLRVRDNGIGIHTEHLPNIFQMFYKASDKSKGSGLGLYIVKETIDKLGGSIAVESTYGVGSTFSVNFPMA